MNRKTLAIIYLVLLLLMYLPLYSEHPTGWGLYIYYVTISLVALATGYLSNWGEQTR
ncbi:MAG: hypothetical protein GSR72_00475 [Desulfurococcales archaeon]|nr:hypothetical protein [Desulfurococcales archaeon]MEB3788352.1 hypothetical protein [Desulfurococcales archaeon]